MTQPGADAAASSGGDGGFILPRSMWTEIVDHARSEAPRECCGLIAGRLGQPVRLHRLTNIAAGNRLYEVDPVEIYDLEFRELPATEMEVTAIYHSHPATEAYPSPTDQAQAFWPEAVYLICSLAEPAAPVIRGFRLSAWAVEEVEVVVQD